MIYPPIKERLFSKIKYVGDCWIYTGAKTGAGYGKIYFEGKYLDAHRISWIIHNGTIPEKMVICHHCDIKCCINPGHLFIGTQADNMRDMRSKNRGASGKRLSDAIKKGWTKELREARGQQTRERERLKHLNKTKKAGVPVDFKFCSKCGVWQPRISFNKNSARYDGLKVYCQSCGNN